jgi:DNA-binding response OmpR family regulator
MKIAILFQSPVLETLVLDALRRTGHAASPFRSLAALLHSLSAGACDAIVLEDDERELTQWLLHLRLRVGNTLPAIVVGQSGGSKLERALRIGATDFVTAHPQMEELVHRLHAHVVRRRSDEAPTELDAGGCTLHAATRTLEGAGRQLALTPREFALLWTLFQHPGRPVRNALIAAQAWGRTAEVSKRTIEQHVYKLRRKLAAHGFGTLRIESEHGIGYRLAIEAEAPGPERPFVPPEQLLQAA